MVASHLYHLVVHNNNNNCNRIPRSNSRFFTISSLRRKQSPTHTLKWPGRNRVQITCNTSSAYHLQHVVLRTTWHKETAQLSLTECKLHLFELYLIGWTINQWRHWLYETGATDQTCNLTQSEISDTGPTSPCIHPITPSFWLGCHKNASF